MYKTTSRICTCPVVNVKWFGGSSQERPLPASIAAFLHCTCCKGSANAANLMRFERLPGLLHDKVCDPSSVNPPKSKNLTVGLETAVPLHTGASP